MTLAYLDHCQVKIDKWRLRNSDATAEVSDINFCPAKLSVFSAFIHGFNYCAWWKHKLVSSFAEFVLVIYISSNIRILQELWYKINVSVQSTCKWFNIKTGCCHIWRTNLKERKCKKVRGKTDFMMKTFANVCRLLQVVRHQCWQIDTKNLYDNLCSLIDHSPILVYTYAMITCTP